MTTPDHVAQAVKKLKEGGIVIFPTDTAFGIGCRINEEEAIQRLFTLRKRPSHQATPVLVSSIAMARKYLQPLSSLVLSYMNTYWPGGLTIVYPCKTELVPELARGGGKTLGMRIPNHPTTQAIIQMVDVPILGPSANFHGQPTPYVFEDLDPKLINQVDYVVPGICSSRQASTVIDISYDKPVVLRRGAIKI